MAESVNLWVASGEVTSRHAYVAYIVFEVVLGWPYRWCDSTSDWTSSDGLKIQYGGMAPEALDATWIPACGLLEGAALEHSALDTWSDEEGPGVPGQGRLPFGVPHASESRVDADWWSWVFWMVTRMEEYTASQSAFDGMGRFRASASMAHAEGWLLRPEVEVRIRAWAASIGITPRPHSYTVQPTIDVDSAYAYRHRSVLRTWGATAKDLFSGNTTRLAERHRVLVKGQPDPYDTYEWLESVHAAYGLKARYFLLLADRGPYDRPVDWRQPGMQALVQRLSRSAYMGIHPGVASHDSSDAVQLKAEISRMEGLSSAPVQHARQHYLLQRIPSTWRRLESVGIEHDHSLGYADHIGFRAGMSRPFRAFDAEANRAMNLTIHPVSAMDATLNRYMGLTPNEALDALEQLAQEVKDVDGVLTLLWHNETVSECNEWKGWRTVYEQVFERVC